MADRWPMQHTGYGPSRPGTLTIRDDHARAVWAKYHERHPDQSFERLHERGGFGLLEAVAYLLGQKFHPGDKERAIDAIFDALLDDNP